MSLNMPENAWINYSDYAKIPNMLRYNNIIIAIIVVIIIIVIIITVTNVRIVVCSICTSRSSATILSL